MTINSHRDLEIWNLAMDLVDDVYKHTKNFPQDEKYGLTSQLRRCTCSVPMNIAEGKGRGTRKDFAHFVAMSKGSLMEAETLLE